MGDKTVFAETLRFGKHPLSENEICILAEETRKARHIGFIRAGLWNTFPGVYTVYENEVFAGACAVVPLSSWTKLGPFVIREQFRGKGYGKALLSYIVRDLEDSGLYIGSSNPKVRRIAEALGFRRQPHAFRVPAEIYGYLLSYLFTRFSLAYIKDAIGKRTKYGNWNYSFLFRTRNTRNKAGG